MGSFPHFKTSSTCSFFVRAMPVNRRMALGDGYEAVEVIDTGFVGSVSTHRDMFQPLLDGVVIHFEGYRFLSRFFVRLLAVGQQVFVVGLLHSLCIFF